MNLRNVKLIFGNVFLLVLLGVISSACHSEGQEAVEPIQIPDTVKYQLSDINLGHWKVTLPIGNPTEVKPPAILDYKTNNELIPYMYNDSTDGALVFYVTPTNSTTANSSYSRTELREQMEPGNDKVNWTFTQGGSMKGTLAVDKMSKDIEGDYHRTIVMQIHGRLTDSQKQQIKAKDNNAPPMLKIYWQDRKILVKTKQLKSLDVDDNEILFTDAWEDAEGDFFSEEVGFEKFTLEVIVSDGKLEVKLNNDESLVYDNESIKRWSVFENYFKAGNYFQSKDAGSSSSVKYYNLKVSHP